MIKTNNKKCYGCNSCLNVCPKFALCRNKEGVFYSIKGKRNLCISCGACDNVCPINYPIKFFDGIYEVFAVQTKNRDILNKSSSGGFFYECCKYFLENGYKVFASRFDDDFVLIHDEIKDIYSIEPFLGSKYLKSDTAKTFCEVKKYLKSGNKVVYIGTPCEIASLVAFLKRKPDNLFLIDFACHGAPSQFLFSKYLKELEKKYSSSISSVNFRDKKYGWNHFSLKVDFESGDSYVASHLVDPYMQLFFEKLFLA